MLVCLCIVTSLRYMGVGVYFLSRIGKNSNEPRPSFVIRLLGIPLWAFVFIIMFCIGHPYFVKNK